MLSGVGCESWLRVPGGYVVLESDLVATYNIDNYDPARFNDIHALVFHEREVIYTSRVSGGSGRLVVPCGVITTARGRHDMEIAYTNNTVIARSGQFRVGWPPLALQVPLRIETYTTDVLVKVNTTRRNKDFCKL